MNNKITSRVWAFTKEKMQEILDTSSSYQEVLEKVGLQNRTGNNIVSVKRRIEIENLSEDKLNQNREIKRLEQVSKLNRNSEIPNELVFCQNSRTCRTGVKAKIRKYNLIEYKCGLCPNIGIHRGIPLSLQLDHINGINDDNRIENLRFLCPNCHSQTESFSNKKLKAINHCECGKKIGLKSKRCFECAMKTAAKEKKTSDRNKKINWPDPAELQKLLWLKPTSLLAKDLGVSDVAIYQHAKQLGLTKPNRGYWASKRSSVGDSNPRTTLS